MINMEDFFGMGFEEEPELTNDLVQGNEPEGGGWGSFLLGGAIGSVMGAVSQTSERSCHPAVFESFSSEEKIFLRQIWRFEEEIDKAQEQDDVERMVLLLNEFVGCMHVFTLNVGAAENISVFPRISSICPLSFKGDW